MKTVFKLVAVVALATQLACDSSQKSNNNSEKTTPERPQFLEALTFYSGFSSETAEFAPGDGAIYSTTSRNLLALDSATAGLAYAPDVSILADSGRFGSGLNFGAKTRNAVFFKCTDNLIYNDSSWHGTVSFWLKLDPSTDLEPGYCDPIQITDVNFNDAAIWVDFTDANPRKFRLGVLGDLIHWDPNGVGYNDNPEYDKRLAVVDEPPFSRQSWTHIAISYEDLGGEGLAILYVDGLEQERISPMTDPFTWDLDRANMYLGLNYIGLFDELSVYNKPLTPEEVKELYAMEVAIADLL